MMTAGLSPLRMQYEHGSLENLLQQSDVLAVIGFGCRAPDFDDPRYLRVGLEPIATDAVFEVWRVAAKVTSHHSGRIRSASDGNYQFGVIELDEAVYGGLSEATAVAYRELSAFHAASATPYILRIWNYFDAINEGDGDNERYKQFCMGRALGMGDIFTAGYPAATAIGRVDGQRRLQMYWLAARAPGTPLENPRQISAYRYPRQYGPVAPSFARAVLSPTYPPQLHISGTAAVLGHASQHADDCAAQFDEAMINLNSLLKIAASAGLPNQIGPGSVLKVYLRHAYDQHVLKQCLQTQLPDHCSCIILQGDICRSELLVEIDGTHRTA